MKLIILLLFFTGLFADHDHHINKELSHLDLSKEQSSKIKEILHEFTDQLKEFEKLKKETDDKRKNLFLKEVFDVNEFDNLNRKLDIKAHEIENNFLIKMHNILYLKQRAKFVDYFDDWEVK